MAISRFKHFRIADTENPSADAVVFVHGIFSNHKTFDKMADAFAKDVRFRDWDLMWFEYDFHQPLEKNGSELADWLYANHTPESRVILVCHSMGGLVGRMAVLGGRVPFVRKLFLLGTPNFGAIRTAKLGLQAMLALYVTRHLWAVFQQQPGVLDLTNVNGVFEKYFAEHSACEDHATNVEYVTIPGLFFHENRSPLEQGDWGEWQGHKNWFTLLKVGIDIWNGYLPLWKIDIQIPHDGIVEDVSNCLVPPKGKEEAYYSEKFGQIQDPPADHATYAHLAPPESRGLTHVQIHNDSRVIRLVLDLASHDRLDDWCAASIKTPEWHRFVRRLVPGLPR